MGNIMGLFPKTNQSKIKAIGDITNLNNINILAFSETHLNSDIFDSEIEIDEFISHRCDRSDRSHGGVIIYVRNIFPSMKILEFSNNKCEVVGVLLEKHNTIIINVYRPPNCKSENICFSECLMKIQECLNIYSSKAGNLIICGDFNMDFIRWPDGNFNGRGSSVALDKMQASELLDLCECLDLYNISIYPTRGKNVLDLLFTNGDFITYKCSYVNRSISDHDLIEFSMDLNNNKENHVPSQNPYEYKICEYEISDDCEGWNDFYQAIDGYDLSEIENISAEEQVETFYQILEKNAEIFLPKKYGFERKGEKKRKFIPDNIRKLLRKRLKLSKKKLTSNSWVKNHRNIEKLEKVEEELASEYRKKKLIEEKRAIAKIENNSSYFYKYAKKFCRNGFGIPSLMKDGNLVSDDLEKTEILSDQYRSVWTVPKFAAGYDQIEEFFGECKLCMEEVVHICKSDTISEAIYNFKDAIMKYEPKNCEIPKNMYKACVLDDMSHSVEDFEEAIDELSMNAACGPDGLSAELIKKLKYPVARFLHLIFKTSLKDGKFPTNLKHAYIAGIFKSGNKSEPANYRPISLTNHISKLMERVVRKDIVKYLEVNNLWDNRQHGARKGRSTLSQLLLHYDAILESLDQGKNVDIIYLDFKKAYDKVCQWTLVQKLATMGFTGRFGKWLSSFILERTQPVKIGDKISKKSKILSGVPQGSVLGPILFLIFISDIGQKSDQEIGQKSDARAFLYVDDSKIIKEISDEEGVGQFQNDIDHFYDWAGKNGMSFNETKFVVLRYGKNHDIKNNTIYFTEDLNLPIDELDHHKDLGVLMSSNGKFEEQINSVIKKCQKKINWICRSFISRDMYFMKKMFNSLIRPHLDYCAQLWAPREGPSLDKLEKVLKKYTDLIPEIRHLKYSDRLEFMKIQSVQRRYDRYRILYVRKCLMGIVPNEGIHIDHNGDHRNGVSVRINNGKSTSALREASFYIYGPKVFNALPKDLREIDTSMETFKSKLDDFLTLIPDIPRICSGSKLDSNDLDRRIAEWNWRLYI